LFAGSCVFIIVNFRAAEEDVTLIHNRCYES
jgi:hypothetical protein